MKAIIINNFGGSEVLQEVEIPKPKPTAGRVLVNIAATSINPIDWKIRQGHLQQMLKWNFPIVLGYDLAGVISELGEGVMKWNVGDRVAARKDTSAEGTYAEYTTVSEADLALIPEEVSFETAAATPLAGLTAWQALHDFAHIKPGQRILIHAGAGGVGMFAIQFAKLAGAYVITTASSVNADMLYQLGADEVIDYHTTDFSTVATNIDIVIDAVGGETQQKSLVTFREDGARILLVLGMVAAETQSYADAHNITVSHIWMSPNGKQLAEILELIRTEKVSVKIASTFPLTKDGVAQAHGLSESGHTAGKIVIQVA